MKVAYNRKNWKLEQRIRKKLEQRCWANWQNYLDVEQRSKNLK